MGCGASSTLRHNTDDPQLKAHGVLPAQPKVSSRHGHVPCAKLHTSRAPGQQCRSERSPPPGARLHENGQVSRLPGAEHHADVCHTAPVPPCNAMQHHAHTAPCRCLHMQRLHRYAAPHAPSPRAYTRPTRFMRSHTPTRTTPAFLLPPLVSCVTTLLYRWQHLCQHKQLQF